VGALIAVLLAVSPAELLAQAEAAFAQGTQRLESPREARPHFRRAAQTYDQLRRAGAHNASLCRNQGTAHLLAGDLPEAIQTFRAGLRHWPADRELRAALGYAREQVLYPQGSRVGRPATEARFAQLAGWALPGAAALFYAVAWLAGARWLVSRAPCWLWIGSVCLTVSLGLGGWLLLQRAERPLVVVKEDGVLLRAGNGLSYPPRSETPLNRGVEAALLFRRGEWVQVELASGEVGWIAGHHVLVEDP
jgi:hypothetical protein